MVGYYCMLSLLAILTFFGFGTAINLFLRRWWISLALYLLFLLYVIVSSASHVSIFEWVLLGVGLVSVGVATWTTRLLKARGYALFS